MGKRYLIDSNSLIEFVGGVLPEFAYNHLSAIIDEDFNISFINKIEVLGHRTADQRWINFINQAAVIKINDDIIDQTVQIRKKHKIKLPDAIVAATAIINDLTLITRNTNDFKGIEGLNAENPWLWEVS